MEQKTILQDLQDKINKADELLLKVNLNMTGNGTKEHPGLSNKNPIHIAEILRLKTLKLGTIGQLVAECVRAEKLCKTLNKIKHAELLVKYQKETPEEKMTITNAKITIEMKDLLLEHDEATYLVEHYRHTHSALIENIAAIKYKYSAFKN